MKAPWQKPPHPHTQTLICDLCCAPASVFTVNWTSPKCTPQRTLLPLFSSTLPGDSVRMKQRYEQLELPLNETYQRRQSQQHRLPIALRHDWTNSGRARMKKVGDTTEELFICCDRFGVKRCLRIKCILVFCVVYICTLPCINNS